MGTVWSGYTSTGPYTMTRVRVDYNGTSATATLCYTRTNTYSGATGGTGSFTFAGQTTNYDITFSGQQTDAAVASVSFSISTSGGTYSGSSSSVSGFLDWSGSVTVPAQTTGPSGLQLEILSQTWNSVTMRGKVTDWGSGSSDFSRHFAIMDGNSSGSTWLGRIEKYIDGNSTDWGTVTTSNATADATLDGGINLIGQTFYKVGLWASTNVGATKTDSSGLCRTPTAPIEALTLTKSDTANGYDVTISITGGDNTKNADYDSSNWYRYSLDNGATWSTPVRGSNDARPWVTKTFTVSVSRAHKIIVEAQQGYYDMSGWDGYAHSETKTAQLVLEPALYGSVQGVSKKVKKLYGPVNGQSKKIIKLYASVNGQSKLIYKE